MTEYKDASLIINNIKKWQLNYLELDFIKQRIKKSEYLTTKLNYKELNKREKKELLANILIELSDKEHQYVTDNRINDRQMLSYGILGIEDLDVNKLPEHFDYMAFQKSKSNENDHAIQKAFIFCDDYVMIFNDNSEENYFNRGLLFNYNSSWDSDIMVTNPHIKAKRIVNVEIIHSFNEYNCESLIQKPNKFINKHYQKKYNNVQLSIFEGEPTNDDIKYSRSQSEKMYIDLDTSRKQAKQFKKYVEKNKNNYFEKMQE